MNRIKEVLENKGIKQTWLSDKLNKSYNMVNSYVQNRRQPSLEDLFKIAKILDVAVAELLETHTPAKTYDSIQPNILTVAEGEEEYEMSINKFHHCMPTDMIKFFMRIPECAEIFSFFIFSKL